MTSATSVANGSRDGMTGVCSAEEKRITDSGCEPVAPVSLEPTALGPSAVVPLNFEAVGELLPPICVFSTITPPTHPSSPAGGSDASPLFGARSVGVGAR